MKLFRKKVKNSTENTGFTSLMDYFDNNGILDAVRQSDLTSATYYACMQIRCNALAKIPFKLYRKDGDGSEAIEHNLSELLKFRPNIFTSAHDFLWATEFQRIEYGNAYWVYDISNGRINGIYLLDSRCMEIIIDDRKILSDKYAVYYVYSDSRSGQIIYSADQIVHFKNFSSDGIRGTPIKKYISDVIAQEKSAQRVVKEKYQNGLQDPLIVTYTGDLSETKNMQIKKKFANLGGVQNAGKVVPVPTDFGVKQIETKLVNSQFFELNGLTTRHIANAFGVKSFQLNDMEKSTYANIEQQNRTFYSDTLQNVLTAYEQEITYKLLSRLDRMEGIYIKGNADVMLRSDIDTRYKAYSDGISSGFLSIAEVRKREELPFITGTDRLIIGNGASIPLEDLGRQYGGDSDKKI